MPEALPSAPPFPPALRARLEKALLARKGTTRPRTRHLRADGMPLFTNRLLLEKSPYLHQHAHNPVNWYPWGEEAFATARRLDRPLLVSIGYSTCHWCHVMEEESFESIETAKILNAYFIPIKVDREVRPDVDAIYMGAIHAMGESGGWPLNMFVTPDGKPFFGGTYFPPRDRGGRPGFARLLKQVAAAYRSNREEIEDDAAAVAAHLERRLEGSQTRPGRPLDGALLSAAMAAYERAADREWGGLGQGTKFPASLPIGLLLREWRRRGDEDALMLARLTLDRMAAGGIHDQLGGGFHRYSTDRRWLVPHFEKMLYDNALIAVAYLEAFQATGDPAHERVLRATLDQVLREMTDPEGGFYSATDADSPGPGGEPEEGFFFTWTPGEVETVLGAEAARVPIAWYGIVERGPVEGRSVLHVWRDRETVATELGLGLEAFDLRLAAAREKMFRARSERPRPLRDDKILVGWNGLMISALARAGFGLAEPRYVEAAARAADFILGSMVRKGRLVRVSLDGHADGPAFLEDHAFLIAGLIDLYEATGEPRWIEAALRFQAVQDEHHGDAEKGGYYQTADDAEVLLLREKPLADGAIPSGNAVAASNLSRLAALTGDDRFDMRLERLHTAFAGVLERAPMSSATLLAGLSDRMAGLREIVIVEPASGSDPEPMLRRLRRQFVPNRVLIRTREGAPIEALAKILPIVEGKKAIGGRPTVYVCENRVCRLPTNDPSEFGKQLSAISASKSIRDSEVLRARQGR
ncbi:MAG TPA: thioredoxin domain-containing protein [Deltaproteobacteria bacterium]|nr:thioredoxin domain-containing protein [Deltaproteobacteria bacterium]